MSKELPWISVHEGMPVGTLSEVPVKFVWGHWSKECPEPTIQAEGIAYYDWIRERWRLRPSSTPGGITTAYMHRITHWQHKVKSVTRITEYYFPDEVTEAKAYVEEHRHLWAS